MKRNFYTKLKAWASSRPRKPLVLSGVRQSGKTYLLKYFAQNEFPNTHYLNFEEEDALGKLFDSDLKPDRILRALSFHLDRTIDLQEDLIIFDEIQACPRALTSLKYFNEKYPELAIACAGSLLGVQLAKNSFPVGKVHLEHLYPMSFAEFLIAIDDLKSIEFLEELNVNMQTPEIIHDHLWERLKWYFIVGGLPEVVSVFNEHKENLFEAFKKVRVLQNILINAYYADIAKHAGKANALHVDRVWRSVPAQLANAQDDEVKRFRFKHIIPGIDRYQRLANAIDWLKAASMVIKVPVINNAELPLTAYEKESLFKLYFFDVGLLGAISGLPPKTILDYSYGTYKGYFAENFVIQEFLASGKTSLHSWQADRSEVDLLYVNEDTGQVLPVEIKSGLNTSAKSLDKYVERYSPPYRTIISAHPLDIDVKNEIHRYPLYLAYRFPLL